MLCTLALMKLQLANSSLNQEDAVKEVCAPTVRETRPSIRKLGARFAFRSEIYPAQNRCNDHPFYEGRIAVYFSRDSFERTAHERL